MTICFVRVAARGWTEELCRKCCYGILRVTTRIISHIWSPYRGTHLHEISVQALRVSSRPPFAPEQSVHPRVRDLTTHDAVFAQRPFTYEAEFLQNSRRCRVASIGLGLDPVQVQCVECPLQ